MVKPVVSIIIVHTNEPRLIRQTLRGIRRAAVSLPVEVVIVGNNPDQAIGQMLAREFPEVSYTQLLQNRGFGQAMNVGIEKAKGEYILIFNPDIIVQPGSIEKLVEYLSAHEDVAFVGPSLKNADGTLQYSCQRFHDYLIPIYRRTPLGKTPFGRKAIRRFLMQDEPHDKIMDVDWLMGSAIMTRAQTLKTIGVFDDFIFMYFEDTDLCRRAWEHGLRVVYNPEATMVHFHRRASADGGLWRQLLAPLTWQHMRSALYYFWKYRGKNNPHNQVSLTEK